ncbi:glycoside hydrolase domain-containing protein [Streptomyces sp. NPDC086989]|uniref:glycoside hydrolase domain-containing protein n=1 Tax=Streptomyces sp. NPDC086989 TaxID=3365764 RepID=UPI0038116213
MTYRGLTVDVPATWSVVDLEAAPSTCVRFDRRAVYLGHPGAEQSCPSHLAGGRTDALLLEPMDGAAEQDLDSALRVPAGSPAPSRLNGDHDHEARVAIQGAGILATAAYDTSDEGVAAVLRRARVGATAKAVHLPPKSAAAQQAAPVAPSGLAAATGYTGPGFDTCSAPSSAAMKAWTASPYRAVGIYIGGRNRGCPIQPQLTSGWVSEQVTNGWHLLPIFVDLQAGGISPANAFAQGRESADAAVADAVGLGLTADTGTVIYNDMENYTDPTYRSRVLDYLSGWSKRLHERGYRAGVYAGSQSGVRDLASVANDSRYTKPDVVWSANWNLKADVSDPSMNLPGPGYWPGQRIHQYRGEVTDTYGGVSIHIDRNHVDVAAGAAQQPGGEEEVSRAKGDFDGDGRDDVAVLYDYGREGERSHSGLWTFTSNGTGFNSPRKVWDSGSGSWNWTSTKLTVGDFNGDGKADIAALYDMGRADDDRNRTKLFTFTNNGDGFNAPVKVWDSIDDAVRSWNWEGTKAVAGDFNGDGRTDIGVLYDYGATDSGNRTGLWTFTSTGTGFTNPKKAWDSSEDPVKSWNWNASKAVAGDFNGDSRTDIGVLYDYGATDSGNRTGLWTFTSTGTGFTSPKKAWDSSEDPVKSWNWNASKTIAGDFNGDRLADVTVLYDYGRTDEANRSGLWAFTATDSGFHPPRLGWDSRTDPVKSWNWSASKAA